MPPTPPEPNKTRASSDWVERRRDALRYIKKRLNYLADLAGKEFMFFSLLMRLPSWSMALAVLVIMTTRTGEVTLGTYAAGIIALTSAMSHRTYRALSLRIGQRAVMFGGAVLNIPAVAILLLQTLNFEINRAGGSIFHFLLAAAFAGITTVPLGALMRSYWSKRYTESKDRRMLNAATAFESMLDILAFPLAAFLVGIIVMFGDINAPLYAVIIIDFLGLLFIVFRPSVIKVNRTALEEMGQNLQKGVRGNQQLGWLPILGISCLGVGLGATQTMLALLSISQTSVVNVGLYLAAVGSAALLTALLMAVLRARVATWQGWLIIGSILTLSALLLSVPSTGTNLLLALFFFGAVLGAGLVSMDSITTAMSVHGNIDLAHSTSQATYLAGLALGYVWGGVFGVTFGVQSALLVPVIASVAFLVVGHVYGYRWRSAYEEKLKPLPEDLTLKN